MPFGTGMLQVEFISVTCTCILTRRGLLAVPSIKPLSLSTHFVGHTNVPPNPLKYIPFHYKHYTHIRYSTFTWLFFNTIISFTL